MTLKVKTTYFFLLFFFYSYIAIGQQNDWQKAVQWTLYYTPGINTLKIPADSLEHFRHTALDKDSMQLFLSHASKMAAGKAPLWMGGQVASFLLSDTLHKIDISNYGAFFYDEFVKQYFEIAADYKNDWLNYLIQSGESLQPSTQ